MSAAAKPQTSEVVTGSFDKTELATGFITPIIDLSKCGVSKLVVRFTKDDIKINAIGDNKNPVCMVSYTDEIRDCLNVTEDYALGIYELSEFISLTKIFKDGFDVSINKNNIVDIETGSIFYNFIGADISAINEGPSVLSAKLDWFAEFKWESSEFSSFLKALSCLPQDYVKMEGKSGDNTIKMTVCDKDIRTSTFSKVIDLEDEIENDFKVVLTKEALQPIVSGSISNLKVQISNKLVYFYGVCDHYEIKYYASIVE